MFSYCDDRSLFRLGFVSKSLRRLSCTDDVWCSVVRGKWPARFPLQDSKHLGSTDYKHYKNTSNCVFGWRNTYIAALKFEDHVARINARQRLPLISSKNSSRSMCARCDRPVSVCLCSALPATKLCNCNVRLVILVHCRAVMSTGTVRIIDKCFKYCHQIVHLDFDTPGLHRDLDEILETGRCTLLFPGNDAVDSDDQKFLKSLSRSKECPSFAPNYLIVLDGSWSHAQYLLRWNARLHNLPKVQVSSRLEIKCEFAALKKEPRDGCLSTGEAVTAVLQGMMPICAGVSESVDMVAMMQKAVKLLVKSQRSKEDQRRILSK